MAIYVLVGTYNPLFWRIAKRIAFEPVRYLYLRNFDRFQPARTNSGNIILYS